MMAMQALALAGGISAQPSEAPAAAQWCKGAGNSTVLRQRPDTTAGAGLPSAQLSAVAGKRATAADGTLEPEAPACVSSGTGTQNSDP